MSWKNWKHASLAKELLSLFWWNFLAFLAISAIAASQYNVAGVYGLL